MTKRGDIKHRILIFLSVLLLVSGCSGAGSDKTVKPYQDDGVDYSKALARRSQSSEDSDPGIVKTDPSRKPVRRSWTVMIYMVGSDLEGRLGNATKDLEEIDAADLSFQEFNVVAYTGGSERWIGDVPCDRNCVLDMSLQGSDRIVAQTKGNANMGLPETLSSFLTFCDENYPAEHNVLILWDHGGGPLWGYGNDALYDGDSLMLTEMSAAMEDSPFKGGANGRKLDLIGFDACLMASFESMMIWKDYADYYVGSEELEPGDGWDYAFLKALEGPLKTRDLAAAALRSFEEYYAGRKSSVYNPDLTLSCVDLSRIEEVNAAVEALAERMKEGALTGNYAAMARERSESKSFGMAQNTKGEVFFCYDLVDAGDLADHMKELYPEEAASLSDAIQRAVAGRYANVDGASGMNLYYPCRNKGQFAEMSSYYSEVRGSSYSEYLRTTGEQWLRSKSRDWELGSPVESGDEYTLQLTEEQLANMAGASYTILMREGVFGGFIPYMENCKIEPDREGVLHLSKNMQLAVLSSSEGTSLIRAKETESDRKRTVYITQGLQFRSDLTYVDHVEDLETANSVIQFMKDHKSGEIKILNITLDEGTSGIAGGKSTIDITDWEEAAVLSAGDHFVPARDGSGRIRPFREWIRQSSSVWSEQAVGSEVRVGLMDTGEMDPAAELFCQIEIEDINGEKYASELFRVAVPDRPAAEVKTESGKLTFQLFEDHAELREYGGRDQKIEVPETVEGLPVTIIQGGAFARSALFDTQGYDPVQEVVLPRTVTELGSGAFNNCIRLDSVRIPESLKKIGNEAFMNCGALREIHLPDGVECIGKAAFASCTSLSEFRIPKGLKELGPGAFMNCTSLSGFTGGPDNDAAAGHAPASEAAGENAPVLEAAGNSPVLHADGAIYSSDGRELLACPAAAFDIFTVKEGTEKICYGAFAGASVKEVIFPESLSEIGNYAFYNCCEMKVPVLPEGLRKIGMHAFDAGHLKVEKESIPSEPEVIRIPASLETIGEHAFDRFLHIRFEVSEDSRRFAEASGALMNKARDTVRQLAAAPDLSAVYPEGTAAFTEESLYVYDSYADLYAPARNIYLPRSMTKFPDRIRDYRNKDEKAVYHCPAGSAAEEFAIRLGLTYTNEMDRPVGSTEIATKEGTLYFDLYEDHAILTGYSGEDERVEIPAQADGRAVTQVGSGTEPISSYYGLPDDTGRPAPRLTELVIPEGVTVINAQALYDVKPSMEVILPSTVRRLGREAISSRAVVREMPESLEVLEAKSMGNTDGAPVAITPGIRYIDPEAFADVDVTAFEQGGENEYFRVTDGVLFSADGKELVKYPAAITDEQYVIPEGTVSVGAHAFEGCGNLRSIELPGTLKEIGDYAFSRCGALSEIKYGRETEPDRIGQYAFYNCGSLTALSLPPVKEIGDNAFKKCSALSSVHLAEGTRAIGSSAFADTPVSAPEFPESLIRIGSRAFQDGNDGALREGSADTIRIPAMVREIGPDAFGSIGNTAFEVDPENETFSASDGLLTDKDTNQLLICPAGRRGNVTVPDGVTVIDDHAFSSASMVTDIEIPDSVMLIGTVNFEPVREEDGSAGEKLKYSVTIHCSKGSYAEDFAVNRGIPCETN